MNPVQTNPMNPNTRWKIVRGMRQEGSKLYRCRICVRVTHDSKGKTLSLEGGERMLLVPIEELTDMIDTTF